MINHTVQYCSKSNNVGLYIKSLSLSDLKVKLQNIEDNIPTRSKFMRIASSITSLSLHGERSLQGIMRGEIDGRLPIHSVTLGDIYHIAFGAYENEDYFYTYTWLTFVYGKMKSDRISELEHDVTISNVGNLLASASFKVSYAWVYMYFYIQT